MSIEFKKANKAAAKLRLALAGISGGGKTYTALAIAKGIGGSVVVIDTENNSSTKYSDVFSFDQGDLKDFTPEGYISAIKSAENAGYDIIILDSLTHAWENAKDEASNAAAKSKSHNTYVAWKNVTPRYKKIQEAIVQSKCHIIGTYRAKDEMVLDENNKPKKVGMGIEAGKHQEYEFDVVLEMEDGGRAVVSKSRYSPLTGKVFMRPGEDLGKELAAWLSGPEKDWIEMGSSNTAAQNTKRQELERAIFSATSMEELLKIATEAQAARSQLLPIEVAALQKAWKEKELSLG